jgi:hypothetical protein
MKTFLPHYCPVLRIRIDAYPVPAFHAFHYDAFPDPDPTFHSDADLDSTTHFFPDLNPPMLPNDPLSLPLFYFYADPDPASKNDADPIGSGSATIEKRHSYVCVR